MSGIFIHNRGLCEWVSVRMVYFFLYKSKKKITKKSRCSFCCSFSHLLRHSHAQNRGQTPRTTPPLSLSHSSACSSSSSTTGVCAPAGTDWIGANQPFSFSFSVYNLLCSAPFSAFFFSSYSFFLSFLLFCRPPSFILYVHSFSLLCVLCFGSVAKELKPPSAMARGIKLLHKPCLLSARVLSSSLPTSFSLSLSWFFFFFYTINIYINIFLYTFEISKWMCQQQQQPVCVHTVFWYM